MRGQTPPAHPPTPPPQGTKRKASDPSPPSEKDNQSQTLPPSPKRAQREASFLNISSDGHEDNTQNNELASPGDRPVIHIEPELSDEQQYLLDTIIQDGRNVFFTGSAGSGKSTVLKTAISRLKDMDKKIRICAPTGRAAVPLSGTTTYSFMGWAPDFFTKGIRALREITWQNKAARKRIRKTEVLIIDEVSMVSSKFLDCMNECLKRVREDKRHLPFGGIQVIVTGDFCQLAPVEPFQYCYHCGAPTKFNDVEGLHTCTKSNCHGRWADEDKWAFRSNAWAEANFACFNLRGIHRQNDPTFIKILQKCRFGIPFTENDIDLLMNHDCEVEDAPQLLSTRDEVDPINHTKFQAITEYEPKRYKARDGFQWNQKINWENEKYSKRLKDATLAVHKEHQLDPVVGIKQTMQVMLQVNLDIRAGLVNGSQGVICGWETIELAKLPILQGQYSTEREGYVRAFTARHIAFHPDKRDHVWPRVRFSNGRVRTIYPWCVTTPVGDLKPYSLLHRTQIPLVPGWAITIHKSQGMTLERAIVNVNRAFANGQVYVALSRAKSLRGLKVEGSAQGLTVGEGGNEEVRQFLADTFGTEMFEQLEDEETNEQ
ncbi:atp-dependent dna helicase pif1 [Fusarium sp. NRRL 52700]|nr:atp-dependent dna helicase pif1 [Fusarium sp. NRRL 52700]